MITVDRTYSSALSLLGRCAAYAGALSMTSAALWAVLG